MVSDLTNVGKVAGDVLKVWLVRQTELVPLGWKRLHRIAQHHFDSTSYNSGI